ncbi:hypothetical protein POM88_036957 [Heracleum sosnowskyi]|uniref:Plastid-targeted protein 4 n=1 Tax=Heracleum sosnowskyi TaxID=360622 RepID=A0AAD8HP89_9APIA|nr:hypothetical protein POM88_036957 [Heracleum sosnowskyi]
MSTTRLLVPLNSYSSSSCVALPRRFRPVFLNQSDSLTSSSASILSSRQNFGCGCVSSSIKFNPRIVQKNINRNLVVYSSMQPGTPIPSGNPSGTNWKGWVVGLLLSIVLPFYRTKLTSFLALKKEVETVVDTAEIILDVVEKVAEEVVEIADILEEKLPEGGKMKNAIERVETVAREIAKDADLLEDLLQKVEKAEKEVGNMIEPVIDQINKEADTIGTKNFQVPKSKL